MSVEEVMMDAEERMEKAVSVLKNALAGIRTGRATPGLVDSVRVEAYGSQSPLKQLASVGARNPTSWSYVHSIRARSKTLRKPSLPATLD